MSRIWWIVATVAVAGLGLPATASAQVFMGAGGPVPLAPVVAAPIVAAPIVLGEAAVVTGPAHYYSYYVEFPAPARTYVPYNASDSFTFLGQAYGHAYDRWTWPVMSNASPGLGRYYQLLH